MGVADYNGYIVYVWFVESDVRRRYIDYNTILVSTFVGEGYAAEVVVTGKGSLSIVVVRTVHAAQAGTWEDDRAG